MNKWVSHGTVPSILLVEEAPVVKAVQADMQVKHTGRKCKKVATNIMHAGD